LKIVIDIECNRLINPDKIWCIVCKNIDTGVYTVFRNVEREERERFLRYIREARASSRPGDFKLIGHHLLGFDYPVLCSTIQFRDEVLLTELVDTLVISKVVDYSRKGHSIEDYGIEFGIPKGKFDDFSKYSPEMETYCRRDVDICHRIYSKYSRYLADPNHLVSIDTEQQFQLKVVNALHDNGFCFDKIKADRLLEKVQSELATLDKDILTAFPPREVVVKEFTPKATKFGTISKTSVPRVLWERISEFEVGQVYPLTRQETFNPSSHKQIIGVLNEAGWSPTDKTQTHIDTERELNQLKRIKRNTELDLRKKELIIRLDELQKSGWKVNENNLETLPAKAPVAARLLAKRILLESRRRTLTEWLSLVGPDQRVHGRFYGLGAWTHRMAHQNPNTANIPNEFDTAGKKKLLGKELRSLWCAPRNRLLVGVDAEGIQLRIFAHLINDLEFTDALVKGRKDDKTDPHSLNQRILGSVCKSRAAAKRFIYALLLGAGMGKLAEILGCSEAEAKQALDRLLSRYTGWAYLKEKVFPKDASRGWFVGLDGRKVRIPGDTASNRKHLAMSGYLQNGEAVVMKLATLQWIDKLKEYDALLVNMVHDEWQVECPNNMSTALTIAEMMAMSLKNVGQDLQLNCPLAGSYWNDDLKDYTIATNWSKTH